MTRYVLRRGGPGGSIFNPGIPEYLQEAMRFLIVLLPRLPPATYYMRRSPPWTSFYIAPCVDRMCEKYRRAKTPSTDIPTPSYPSPSSSPAYC
eukprot:scaffold6904_cov105-Isochrysis_galbana.AAC.2